MIAIGNIDQKIRNGKGVGSAQVVGWLPIASTFLHSTLILYLRPTQVTEDAEHKGKTTFTNFKRVVWHESFRHILSTIQHLSTTGFLFPCPDGVTRLLFPYIHTLIADYEEQ